MLSFEGKAQIFQTSKKMRVMSTAQNGQHKNESEAAKEISIPGTLIRNMNYYNFSEELY